MKSVMTNLLDLHPVSRATRAARQCCGRNLSLVVTLLVLIAVASPCVAQTDRGTIEGLVTDQSGAVVPGASVQIVQTQTNTARDYTTNNEGLYTAPNLPLGTYKVVVKKQGFGALVRDRIEIRPNVKVRVDMSLTPGAVQQEVTVSSEAPLLDVSTTSNTAGLGEKLVNDLPVINPAYQRSVTQLLNNLPGSTNSGDFVTKLNGGAAGDLEVYLDGAPGSEWGIARGGFSEVSPAIEQVGEFSVASNGFNAEYGGFGNSVVNVTIKSGTSQLHGSVWDHLSNDALNAKNYFATGVTPFKQNEGGFTLGGPIVIPRVYNGKNKTFFFGSLNLFRSRVGASGNLITVPTARMLGRSNPAGDFDFSELGVPIYDPTTGNPFPGNIIPHNRISPAAAEIVPFIPSPDMPGIVNNFHSAVAPNWPWLNSYTTVVKVDHSLSNTQKVSVTYQNGIKHRVIWEQGLGPHPVWGADQTNPLDHVTDQIANNWKFRFNHDYIISPTLINHVVFSVDSYKNRGANKTAGQGWDNQLGITGIPADDGSFPAINFSGGVAAPINFGRSYDEDWREKRFFISENITWIHGKHTFKFGGEWGRNHEDRRFGGASGTFTFSNNATGLPSVPNSGSSFASFLLGRVTQASAYIPLETRLRFNKYGLFAQDEWKVTNSLTISYGLRWDYMPPMYEVDDFLTSFDPNLPNPGAGGRLGALAYAGKDGYNRTFQDPWRRGFGPRLGIAYQLSEKTVVRASSGIVYANSGNQVPFTTTGADGYTALPTFNSPDGGYTPVFLMGTESFPQNFNMPPVIDPSFLNGQAISYIPRTADRLPQIVNWNLAIQRELIPNLSLEVAYQGSRSTHLTLGSGSSQINYLPASNLGLGFLLLQPITSPAVVGAGYTAPYANFNTDFPNGTNTLAQALKPYPQYQNVRSNVALLPEGKASFHSLQMKATQRYSRGLVGTFYFTWMKSITNANGGNTTYANFAEGFLQYPGDRSTFVDPGTPKFVFGASYSYDLPFGHGKTFLKDAPKAVDLVLGGWTLSGSLRYQSGAPLQIAAINPFAATFGYSDYFPGVYVNWNGQNPYGDTSDPNNYLNPAAFSAPPFFAFGDAPRFWSNITSPWLKQESLSLRKTFQLTERLKFELGADATNPFNIVRWGSPNTTFGVAGGSALPTFGKITTTQGARQMQINMKLAF
ncbi:MAG TPA: TonB-dependent receptor [Terriglobales bacterium]|nr:TonB-dependent receptor [Terriglobales bacterium]